MPSITIEKTEEMNENKALPHGWVECELKDLSACPKNDIVDGPFGSNLKASEYINEGVPIIRLQNIDRVKFVNKNIKFVSARKANQLSRHSYKKGDIVITKLGVPLGKACIIPDYFNDGIIVADVVRIRLNENHINKFFICYALNSETVSNYLKILTKGTTRPRVNLNHVREIPILLPPLREQERIVEKIEELFSDIDDGIKTLEKTKLQIKQYRQSVLKSAFEGKLYKTTEWEEVTLKDITSILGDGLHGTPTYSDDGEYYFINGNNLNDGNIQIKSETKSVSYEEYLKYKKDLNEKTIFVSINGTIGNTAFYNNEKVILGKSACYFNVLDGIDKNFIRYLLKTTYFINYASTNATGSTIKNVSLKTMRDFLFNKPSIEEQEKIVEEIEKRFKVADVLEQAVDEGLEKAKQLKQSILKKAFEGKLVPQNPTDEPATSLLNRINIERGMC